MRWKWRIVSVVILGILLILVNGSMMAASENEFEQKFIPGLAAADIKLNLQKLGFKFTGPRPVKDTDDYLDDGKLIDPDTGVELSCTITAENPLRIKYVTFRVDGTSVAGFLPAELYLALAKAFLGYVATIPYDDSEPVKAKEWVETHIGQTNKPGEPVTTIIGPVEFTLAGGKYMRFLSVQAKGNSE